MSSMLGLVLSLHLVAIQDPTMLERRLARLDRLRREAGAVMTHADSLRHETFDTVKAGALIIFTRPQDAARVRPAAQMAWPRIDSMYGDAAADLANRPMLFWFPSRDVRIPPQSSRLLQPVIADSNATREDIAWQIMSGAAARLRADADSELTNWLGPLLLPINQPAAELSRVYVDLVTVPSAAVRRCYQGDAASCRVALGILDGGDRASLWYDAAERRVLVSRMDAIERGRTRAAADACLLGHSDEGCLIVLRAAQYLDAPLGPNSRHSFARLALTVGGSGAYARLRRSAGKTLSERFAIASGLPSDSLARRWRATILAARPNNVTLVATAGWTALGWCVLFGLLALRSTRWR